MKEFAASVGLMLISAAADAQGFLHASKVWKNGSINSSELTASTAGFVTGIASYWLSVKFLGQFGVVSPEIQTAIWMTSTLIGVAFLNKDFFSWPMTEKIVALGVVAGIGWLATRVGK